MGACGVRGVGHGPLEHFDRESGETSTGEERAELQGTSKDGRVAGRLDGLEPLSRRIRSPLHRRALHRPRGDQARIVVPVVIRMWRAGFASETDEASASTSDVPLDALVK